MTDLAETEFMVSLEGDPHGIGDAACDIGWCGPPYEYPKKCRCGGLIHADFGEEGYDGYWLYQKCDKCGDDYRAVGG